MTDVFISYAHEDQDLARRMASALERDGFSVWWDHSIPPGQTWDSHIARGIKEAKAAIVIWSRHSVTSDWVKEEASIAREAGKYLPVQMDENPPPIGFSRIQAAQLIGWNGDPRHPQWQMLVGEVRRAMSAIGPAPAPRPTPRYVERKGGAFAPVLIVLVAALSLGGAGYFYLLQGRALHAEPPEFESTQTAMTSTPTTEASLAVTTTTSPSMNPVPGPLTHMFQSVIGEWRLTRRSDPNIYCPAAYRFRAHGSHIQMERSADDGGPSQVWDGHSWHSFGDQDDSVSQYWLSKVHGDRIDDGTCVYDRVG